MQKEFERWYVSKFLNLMSDAESSIISLRNSTGGYDDHHIDGAWECWQHKELEKSKKQNPRCNDLLCKQLR